MRAPPKVSRPVDAVLREYGLPGVAVVAATLLCLVLESILPVASLALVYVCAVLAVALLSRTAVAAFTAILSWLTYNFFFTEPRLTLHISSPSDVAAVTTFLVAALTVGHLAARQRAHLVALRLANDRVRSLQILGQRLAAAVDERGVFESACEVADDALDGTTLVVAIAGPGAPLVRHASPLRSLPALAPEEEALARATATAAAPGAGAETASPWWFLALPPDGEWRGAIGFRTATPADRPGRETALLAQAIAHQTAAAAQRARLAQRLEAARLEGETERLRTALLSSVSHDLRSPLAAVIGAASSLTAYGESLAEADRRALLESIRSESERLDRYIQNLLDMTRLGSGPMKLQRDWVALEEVLGSAEARLRRLFPSAQVVDEIEPGLPPLFVHAALLEQALFNVLENAAKFSPEAAPIRVRARREAGALVLEVTDRGPGIPDADRQRIFDLFYSAARGDRAARGSGLGLTIVRGMIGAHGGKVAALEGEAGVGTTIRMTLPLPEPPPAAAEEAG